MTLEEHLRIYDMYNIKQHHHVSQAGQEALKMMRQDIQQKYFRQDSDQDKRFKSEYLRYQSKQILDNNPPKETMKCYEND